MTSKEIRQQFLDFFKEKGHKIVPSAPIVNKNDPTLMFTNAGMNQFKDFFLGNKVPDNRRITDTQKCLRVSGKHNDLEEVGVDSYHHTMFEMLGNWSVGDYFKEEAIAWAWELLTDVFKLDKDRLYVTVFSGDKQDGLEADEEAADFWKKWVPEDRILYFDRKDNFWEMGDVGPCGPCTEIHIDLRSEEERRKLSGKELVNQDDPLVVEIWNLVFIQFDRKSDGSLENLPEKHVDTGMGFERLCMAVQGKKSNYATDVFMPFINFVEKETGKKYTASYAPDAKKDIAMRVIVDHIRAVSMTIADGQMPGNTGAGYVVRRILRRAVRYYFSFLDKKEPFLYRLVPMLADSFKDVFPELYQQKDFVANVVKEEEKSFLRTLEGGLRRLASVETTDEVIDGKTAFELFDTFGFPIDLTRLIAEENGLKVDEDGFKKALQEQKDRSRSAATKKVGDWYEVGDAHKQTVEFIGYDTLEVKGTKVLKYRTVKTKKKVEYQVVIEKTPFYAESGGQVGDKGFLWFGEEKIRVLDTQKENDLIIHILEKLPDNPQAPVRGEVDAQKRRLTENNHSATHLMHAALRQVLGSHVQQKGSLVALDRLRFDYAHYAKMTDEEIAAVEKIVNQKIRENIPIEEARDLPVEEAKKAGAMMLFGEKYGETVRMITFDAEYSRELCGGCHVSATGNIGFFKIVSEAGISAGVRRIEAVTAAGAEAYINKELEELNMVRSQFKNSSDLPQKVAALIGENKKLRKEIDSLTAKQAGALKEDLKKQMTTINGVNFLATVVTVGDAKALKNLAYQLEKEVGNAFIVFGAEIQSKPQLMVIISKGVIEEKGLHAGNIVRELAKEIKGGGGGQPFFATAGGKDADGLASAVEKAKGFVG